MTGRTTSHAFGIRHSKIFRMHPTAETILKDFRGGSSWPMLIQTTSGERCVVKWKGTGEGPLANAVEWISLHLAQLSGIPVPAPHLVRITPDLAHQKQDPEINDLILRSLGINLAVEWIEGALPFTPERAQRIDDVLKHRIYCFDALFLNIDRIDFNPNIIFSADRMVCLDLAALMEIKMLMNGHIAPEKTFLPLVRRHPFYRRRDEMPIDSLNINPGALHEIVDSMPDEWLEDPDVIKPAILSGLTTILNNAGPILQERLRLLDEISLETLEERNARLLANRMAFAAKWPL